MLTITLPMVRLSEILSGPDYKQVIVIRTDIKMGKGKACAQASHASVMATLEAQAKERVYFQAWMNSGMKKIVVKVNSEEELNGVFAKGSKIKVPRALINDAGHTQLAPGTATAVALGPAPSKLLDPITKDLKLL